MTTSWAELVNWQHFSDDHLDALRELLAYDALCPRSNHLVLKNGVLGWEVEPSPFHWSRQVEWPWAMLNADLHPTDECLEVGGGWGVVQYAIAKRCRSLEELDINLDPMQHVRWMQRKHGLGINITQTLGSVLELPYPDNRFDKVFCISVLEHLPAYHNKAVAELVRVLKPGGRLLLTIDVNLTDNPAAECHLTRLRADGVMQQLGLTTMRFGETRACMLGETPVVVALICYSKAEETDEPNQ